MEKKIYFIHDEMKKAWDSDEIILQINDTMAVRAFTDMVRENTYINKHAEDFNLYYCGLINKNDGIIGCTPEKIATGKTTREIIEKMNDEKKAKGIIKQQ